MAIIICTQKRGGKRYAYIAKKTLQIFVGKFSPIRYILFPIPLLISNKFLPTYVFSILVLINGNNYNSITFSNQLP